MRLRFICLLLPLLGFSSLNDQGDFQLWIQQKEKLTLSEKSTFFFNMEGRWGDNSSYLYYLHIEPTLSHKINSLFSFAWGYRQIFSRSSGSFKPTYEPLLDILYKKYLGPCSFSHRSRFSYLVIQGATNTFQYRSLFTFSFKARITPYISEEAFFRDIHGFVQNRITFGGKTNFTSYLQADFFYRIRHLKSATGVWKYQNIAGAYATFFF